MRALREGLGVTADVDAPEVLELYVIYASPSDYPARFVVRRWLIQIGEDGLSPDGLAPLAVVEDLETARRRVPEGLVCVPRERGDDPVIVETWI